MAVAAALDNEAADKNVCVAISAKADLPLIATAALAVVIISPARDEGSLRTEQEEPVTIEIVGIAPEASSLSCESVLKTCPGTVSVLALGLSRLDCGCRASTEDTLGVE